jgi:hypothetical protein
MPFFIYFIFINRAPTMVVGEETMTKKIGWIQYLFRSAFHYTLKLAHFGISEANKVSFS